MASMLLLAGIMGGAPPPLKRRRAAGEGEGEDGESLGMRRSALDAFPDDVFQEHVMRSLSLDDAEALGDAYPRYKGLQEDMRGKGWFRREMKSVVTNRRTLKLQTVPDRSDFVDQMERREVALDGERIAVAGPVSIVIWDLASDTQVIIDALVGGVAMKGSLVVGGSVHGKIEMWNAETGDLLHTLKGHSRSVDSVAIHGSRVVTGSYDKTVKVWNVEGEKPRLLHSLNPWTNGGHSEWVNSVAIDGPRVVSGSDDKTVKVWNVETERAPPRLMHTLDDTIGGHSNYVQSVAIHGSLVVSGSSDKTVKVWNVDTGKLVRTLDDTSGGHSGGVICVAIHGSRVVSGSRDGTVKVWNVKTGEIEHNFEQDSYIKSVAINDRFIVCSLSDSVVVWEYSLWFAR